VPLDGLAISFRQLCPDAVVVVAVANTPVTTCYRPSPPAGICAEFERRLRELNPQLRSITYDIGDLYSWVDNMPDLRWVGGPKLG